MTSRVVLCAQLAAVSLVTGFAVSASAGSPPTVTPTDSPTATVTPTATLSPTPSATPTITATVTPTATPTAAPANDTCAGALALALDVPAQGTTFLAADDYQLPALSPCFTGLNQSANTATGLDAVYAFTAPSADTYSFRVTKSTLNGTATNPVLYLGSDCPAGSPPLEPTCVGASNRSANAEEVLCVPLANGEQVFAFVDATLATEHLNFTIEVERCTLETEPNGTPATAQSGVCGIEGSITPSGDVDFYALGAPIAGARVFALVDGVAAGNNDFDLRVTTATDTLEFDDANGDVRHGSNSPNVAGTELTGAGAYLRIDHSVASVFEPYRLYAVVQPSAGAATAESEPNDGIAQANVAANDYFAGTLTGPAPSSDVDVYGFAATAGELLYLGLDQDPAHDETPVNGRLDLLDATGTVVAAVNDGAGGSSATPGTGDLAAVTPNFPGEALAYRVPVTGTYFAQVSIGTASGTSTGAGDYLLSITRDCVPASGPVQTGTPTPTSTAVTATPTPSVTATPTPTLSPTGIVTPTASRTPTATPTPFCPSPPCEVCDNCLDDDGDQLVDREDTADCPSASGLGAGLPAPRGKAAVKCQKAIEKAGAKFTTQKLKRLHKCLSAELVCVQEKPGDARCSARAQTKCAKEIAALAKDEAKVAAGIARACGALDPADLRDAAGLGYASEEAACIQQFMLAGLADDGDVATCLTRQHECRVEQMVGAQVPRAFELLERAGRDPGTELGCLPPGSDGDDQGLGQPKAKVKAATRCAKAIATAGAKFVKSKLDVARKCADKVFACVQVDAGDTACIDKAETACAKAFAKLSAPGKGIEAKLVAAVVKKCTDDDIGGADLLAAEGLGFGAYTSDCAALGVAPLDSAASIAECLKRRLECRTEQILELQVPRLRELIAIGNVTFP